MHAAAINRQPDKHLKNFFTSESSLARSGPRGVGRPTIENTPSSPTADEVSGGKFLSQV
jgi:hypothetical protein